MFLKKFIFIQLLFGLLYFQANAFKHSVVELKTFVEYKKTFNKSFISINEEEQRIQIFLENLKIINEHNKKYEHGLVTYRMGINKFTDLKPEDFYEQMDCSLEYSNSSEEAVSFIMPKNVELPPAVDWRNEGAVTPVKEQLKCGSCWSFATTGALEGQHFRKTAMLVSLSEQNLIDCSIEYNNHGCNGGNKERAFLYIRDNGGIASEACYPYLGHSNDGCRAGICPVGATCSGYVAITANDEDALTAAVATIGPVAVAINGKCLPLQFYAQGIIDTEECAPTPLTHAMLIVGYGWDNVTLQDYWIVKNSWGSNWGMGGYVYMPRFRNFAGISLKPSYPLV